MVDKEIDAVKKVKSCRTQYSLLDIGINEEKERTKASPLIVKFKKRMTKGFGCNTDISFRPHDNGINVPFGSGLTKLLLE